MKSILVTGANGQLGKCIKDIEKEYPQFSFIHKNALELDITDQEEVFRFFDNNTINWCINCAAYTAVDKAEIEQKDAYNVNVLGAKNLAIACNKKNAILVHVSTDFVFDGDASVAYTEDDVTNPLSVYGDTKLKGEQQVAKHLKDHFIIRTSWLYSEHGNNFMKTMLRLAKSKQELNIVSDQIGSPTYAGDLGKAIIDIIEKESSSFGIYHFSNEGVASWYDFAKTIFEVEDIKIKTNPIKTKAYPTPAKRPYFSVLDTTKIKTTFNIEIPHWKESLQKVITNNKINL